MRVPRTVIRAGSAALATALVFAFSWVALAQFNVPTCIGTFLAKRASGQTAGFDSTQTQKVIRRIAASFHLNVSSITVVECTYEDGVFAHSQPVATDGIPVGEYLVYNPIWVSRLIGEDPWWAVALFGHELGHFFNRDALRKDIPKKELERQADKFAGCAVANLGGDLRRVNELWSRIRDPANAPWASPDYPDRLTSLDAMKEGFTECSKSAEPQVPPDTTASQREEQLFAEARRSPALSQTIKYLDEYPSGKYVTEAARRIGRSSSNVPPLGSWMVFFDYGMTNVGEQAIATLRRVANAYKQSNATHIMVSGHTDPEGPVELRGPLTTSRAYTVKNQLVKLGVPPDKIIVAGMGSRSPLVQTPEGQRDPQNRRTEIVLLRL
jgi:outer membrane protein OmpA-like peptidoglycan-associated protein